MEPIVKFAESDDDNYKYRNYTNKKAVENVVNYVFKKAKKQLPKRERIYGAVGTEGDSINDVVNSFMKVKQIYGKMGVQLKHIIISFGEKPEFSTAKMRKIIMKMISTYSRDFMVAYAIHYNYPYNYHLHIVINSVSKSGKKINISRAKWNQYKKKVKRIWNKECIFTQ